MFASVPLVFSLALSAAGASLPVTKRQGTGIAWCDALRVTCESQITDKDYVDFFSHDACLFGSTCPPNFLGPVGGPLPQRRNVQLFLDAVVADRDGPEREPPHSEDLRVPDSILEARSTDGSTITKQNFIDGFYGALNPTNGPWPTNASVVEDYWNYIVDWTAQCSEDIPFRNFADYFVYSSYVISQDNC